jgi:transcriptional regulator with XRE-family HTH domain
MKLGDVLKKERGRKKLTAQYLATRLRISVEQYLEMETGNSPAEEWGPKLALIAINLKTPTSRLITETGKISEASQIEHQCGKLIKLHRQKIGLSPQDLAGKIGVSIDEIEAVENGTSPLDTYAPLLLAFAEAVDQPIFNLFYPCGLPYKELNDYP